MKTTIILTKGKSEGVLECIRADGFITVNCRFANKGEFKPDCDYILYLYSAKKPSHLPYAIAEGVFKNNDVLFNGKVNGDILQKYGYVSLDIDTYVICERKYGEAKYNLFAKGFTGLIWNVDTRVMQMSDSSINGAKKTLAEMKNTNDIAKSAKTRDKYIKQINEKLSGFSRISFFPPPYEWFFINKCEPIYNLSSLKHALFVPSAADAVYNNGGYYMGIYQNHLAIAVKMQNNNIPLSTLNDVAQIIKKNNDGENIDKYCAAGIFLDDDGQYFEKILAIE